MKKTISLLISAILLFSLLGTTATQAHAASYPFVWLSASEASVGETVPLMFQYYPVYSNEELDVYVYDSSDDLVATADSTFYNSTSIRYYTVNWDTKGYKAGKYTIVVRKFFYSYYQWNETPTPSTFTFTLNNDINKGDKNKNKYKGTKETIIGSNYSTVTTSKNTLCTAYSGWNDLVINGVKLRISEMYLNDTADAMLQKDNMFNPSSDSTKSWYLIKFTATNTTGSDVPASDLVGGYASVYKYTGSKATTLDLATMGDDSTGRYDASDVTIPAGGSAEFWEGIMIPSSQGMPFLKIGNVFVNTNPNAPKKASHYNIKSTTKATATANGKIVTKCSVCGKVKSSTTIKKVSKIKLSPTKYAYDGKVKNPKLTVKDSAGKALVKGTSYKVSTPSGRKNVGKYNYKITFKGNYKGTKTVSFTILPKATNISKLKAESKGITVNWKKQATQTSGYQIQVATNSKFTKNVKKKTVSGSSNTSKEITNLKAKKKYYVRIRTYKTVKGKKYYSSWSSAKTVTTKK